MMGSNWLKARNVAVGCVGVVLGLVFVVLFAVSYEVVVSSGEGRGKGVHLMQANPVVGAGKTSRELAGAFSKLMERKYPASCSHPSPPVWIGILFETMAVRHPAHIPLTTQVSTLQISHNLLNTTPPLYVSFAPVKWRTFEDHCLSHDLTPSYLHCWPPVSRSLRKNSSVYPVMTCVK